MDDRDEARGQLTDEPAAPAVGEGATTGSLLAEAGTAAGIAGLVAGAVFGWLVTLWARRRHPRDR
jgi:hypothetical protein